MTESSENPNSDLYNDALKVISSYGEKGMAKSVLVQRYNDSAKQYEQYMSSTNYKGPSLLAKKMVELYPSNRDVIKILDVASGTGLSGLALWEAGFRQIDAVDPSSGMLDVAREKNVYNRLICDFVDDLHQLDVPDDTYNAVTIVGGMGETQIPPGAFDEIIRVVEPGGLIVNATRVEHYSQMDDFRIRLTSYFRKLEDEGKWKEESRTTFPIFIMDKEGIITVHRVLSKNYS